MMDKSAICFHDGDRCPDGVMTGFSAHMGSMFEGYPKGMNLGLYDVILGG